MSRWFRHYAGMMRDDKLVSAAMRCKQPVERVVWIWGAILESAAEVNDDGKFTLDTAEAAYFLRTEQAELDSIVRALEDLGRVSGDRVVKWGDRQFTSDRSADRTRAYRQRQQKQQNPDDQNVTKTVSDGAVTACDADVTSPKRHRDAPETETEEETEKKRKKDAAPNGSALDPSAEERDYFARGKQVCGKDAGGLLTNLLKARGKKIALARSVIELAATKENPREYIAAAIRGPPAPNTDRPWRPPDV